MSSGHVEDQEPVNLAGQRFIPVASIEVLEFHEAEDGQGLPTEVHLWLKMEGAEDIPFAIRFHSPDAIDQLIVALITHRRAVWGGPTKTAESDGYGPHPYECRSGR